MASFKTIEIPKDDLENYSYLLRLHGFIRGDLQSLTDYIESELLDETETHYSVEIVILHNELISKILPETVVRPGIVYFDDTNELDNLKRKLEKWLTKCGGGECRDYHHIDNTRHNLSNIVRQLAMESVIQKFYRLKDNHYLVVMSGIIFDLEKSKNLLTLTRNAVAYNPRSGFSLGGLDLEELNKSFKQWIDRGDFRRPIIEPNILGTLIKGSFQTSK